MLSIVNSCNLIGIDGFIVNVEVDITRGMPCFNIVGLASIEIKEAKERVKSAIINSGFEFPAKRIVVNLSPADIKKEGSLLRSEEHTLNSSHPSSSRMPSSA